MKWLGLFLLVPALWVQAQAPGAQAIEIPAWFSESFLEFPEDAKEAARDGKRLMLYFGQDGCPYCKQLMQTNFTQRAIVEKTRQHFVAVALNIWGDREVQWTDGRRMSEKELTRALQIQYTPTILFLDERGGLVARVNGYYPPLRFSAALDYAAGLAGKGQRFEDYMKTVAAETASPTLHEQPFLRKPPVELKGAKPVALLFETPYCSGCDELHGEGFKRPEVRALIDRFDVYRLTLDDSHARALRIAYTPSIVLFDGGKEVFRVEAYLRPFHLASALEYVASGAYRKEPSFQRFIQARAERLRNRGEAVELWK
ncbi:MAG: thioredoxin fold domain-containing protein [Betaproteobacteria bacterium]|nr:thioredoxin fold domain-containing protein [Betaproteobacteria bacterium]